MCVHADGPSIPDTANSAVPPTTTTTTTTTTSSIIIIINNNNNNNINSIVTNAYSVRAPLCVQCLCHLRQIPATRILLKEGAGGKGEQKKT